MLFRSVRGASQGELSFGCCSSPSAYASFLLILAAPACGPRHAQFYFGPSCGSHLSLPVFLLCFPVVCFRSRCLFLPPRIVVLCFTLLSLINKTRARNLRFARSLCRNCNHTYHRGSICSALCFEHTVRSDDHLCHGLSGLCEPVPCSILSPTPDTGNLGGHERHSFSLYVGVDLPLCRTGIPPPSILADRVHWFHPPVSNGLSTSAFLPFSFHRLPIARGRTCGMSGSHSPSRGDRG